MNPLLEDACRWFGPASCETADAGQFVDMAICAAVASIVAAWLVSRMHR